MGQLQRLLTKSPLGLGIAPCVKEGPMLYWLCWRMAPALSKHLDREGADWWQQGSRIAGGLHEGAQLLADTARCDRVRPIALLQDEEAHEQLEFCWHGPCACMHDQAGSSTGAGLPGCMMQDLLMSFDPGQSWYKR